MVAFIMKISRKTGTFRTAVRRVEWERRALQVELSPPVPAPRPLIIEVKSSDVLVAHTEGTHHMLVDQPLTQRLITMIPIVVVVVVVRSSSSSSSK